MSENSRRQFLGQSAVATGGIVLALSGVARADEDTKVEDKEAAEKSATLLKLSEHEKLKPIGGFEVIENDGAKIIVAHVEAERFVACSAICTHKGCTVGYEHDAQQFVCPCHGARFALDGSVARGPAKNALQSFDAQSAVALKIK